MIWEKKTNDMTWEEVKTLLPIIGYDTTRYGEEYPVYGWEKNCPAFVEQHLGATLQDARRGFQEP